MIYILGAGISGLSCSYHLGHQGCVILERNSHPGGHTFTHQRHGVNWDEGPHVSFTKSEYVRNLLGQTVKGEIVEQAVVPENYYYGSWLPHPPQSNLQNVPEALKKQIFAEFSATAGASLEDARTYGEWLDQAFGTTFSRNFPRRYTRKYWTVDADLLTTEWVGPRVHVPTKEEIARMQTSQEVAKTHYVQSIRYPLHGGFYSFVHGMRENAPIQLSSEVTSISFAKREILFAGQKSAKFEKLISTLPLPELIARSDAPEAIKAAAKKLKCSQTLLVNVVSKAPSPSRAPWLYVYDEDMLSCRITQVHLLSPQNAPPGKSAIQVEVYFSDYRKKVDGDAKIAATVTKELVRMGLVPNMDAVESVDCLWIPWANIIFDFNRRAALDEIFNWLSQFGLRREKDDLEYASSWNEKQTSELLTGTIFLAGRYAQWKYFWTDDCILRGRLLAEAMRLS